MFRLFKNGFKNGTAILFQQQKTILSGATVIALMVFISAVLGLVRKRLYAGILAAGPEYDVLVAAFRVPDLIFQLLVVGSLNAAFIPLFSRYIVGNKADHAWKFASAVINWTLVFSMGLAALGFVFAPQLSRVLTPGFLPEQQQQLVGLMRIIILSPLLLALSSFIGGMIQSFRRFLLPFFSPVMYNLGAIIGILFLYPPLGIKGLAWGVLLGSVLHLIVVIPLLRHLGFKFSFCLPWRDPSLREMVRLAFPRTLWAGVYQLREVAEVGFASLLSAGSISVLDYGQSLVRLPVSIFGASISQASLPALSELAARNKMEQFRTTFINSFLQILYLVMPVSVIFIVLKIPIVRLVFGTGDFAWWDTVYTSWVLALFSISLFAQAGKELIIRAFYALKETDTPVIIGILSLLIGIILAAILMPQWRVRGLAFGFSVGIILEFVVLLVVFVKRAEINLEKLSWPAAKIFFASAVMAVAIYLPVRILDEVFIDTTKVVNLLVLVWVVLTFGGSVYLFLTWILGCEEIRLFFSILLKIRSWRDALVGMNDLTVDSVSCEGEEMGGVE
ncbi:murein biosynthesis integral membrane protein MurJ [Patescibacteria group bacterium]|nr:murein biosynthesis integral membrane protein MurJ [Patescibacteria group bacterium]MBU1868063.1 murein biosynthesis integral membrane protein MurJ [Patescibacteria group bacterium]